MIDKFMPFTYNHWYEDETNRWHHVFLPLEERTNSTDFFTERIDWIYENVDNCYKHCRWRCSKNGIDMKFRYECDYIVCTLRWS